MVFVCQIFFVFSSFGYQTTLILNGAKFYHLHLIFQLRLGNDDQMIELWWWERLIEWWIFVTLMITLLYEAVFVILRSKHIALIAVDAVILVGLLGLTIYCAIPIFKNSSWSIRIKLIAIVVLFILKISFLPTFSF